VLFLNREGICVSPAAALMSSFLNGEKKRKKKKEHSKFRVPCASVVSLPTFDRHPLLMELEANLLCSKLS